VKEWVYFARHRTSRLIKIGLSANPARRALHELHADIIGLLPGNGATERDCHERFKVHRVTGEWFRDCRAIRSFIREGRLSVPRVTQYGRIAIYPCPDDKLRTKIEKEAGVQSRKLGPMVLEMVKFYFRMKEKTGQ
jgi:hypothetical protein